MSTLVEDLLLLARLDETRPAEREPVDLAVLAADACSDAVAHRPGPAGHARRTRTRWSSRGDQDHLRQAIANLVTNARPPHPGRHAARGRRRASTPATAVVTVRDHGPGLDPDALGARLRPLLAGRPGPRRAGAPGWAWPSWPGIADEHGGTATAENAPDGGAVFTLRIPL